jgi:hypothetical protein
MSFSPMDTQSCSDDNGLMSYGARLDKNTPGFSRFSMQGTSGFSAVGRAQGFQRLSKSPPQFEGSKTDQTQSSSYADNNIEMLDRGHDPVSVARCQLKVCIYI